MTRLWVMSDLHVDAAPFDLPPTPRGVAALVVAGDVADGHARALTWLDRARPSLPIIYVSGNHDYAGHDLHDEGDAEFGFSLNVHLLLPGQVIELDGIRLIGSTLWTNFALGGDAAANKWWAKQHMPDYQTIDVGTRRLRVTDIEQVHRHHLDALRGLLVGRDNSRTMVVTHHAPHPMSLPEADRELPAGASFASDLSNLILDTQPAAWLHGHLHQSCGYRTGRTRIFSNPRGYWVGRNGQPTGNASFDPGLTIVV